MGTFFAICAGALLVYLWFFSKAPKKSSNPKEKDQRLPDATAGYSDPVSVESLSDGGKSSGRQALRAMCREALEDKAISYEEAVRLLAAFEDHCSQHPEPSTQIEYIRHQLFYAIEDGQIDAAESHELVTTLGEFADFGLYHTREDGAKRRRTKKPGEPIKAPKKPGSSAKAPAVELEGRYLMTYVDADGELSRREIKPKRVEQRGEHMYLVSYCLKARAPRTFRVDRIESLVDSETGEYLVL